MKNKITTDLSFWNILLENQLSKSDIELFAYLVSHYSDGTLFTINKVLKNEIVKQTGKALSSYNNSTSILLKLNLIYKAQPNTQTYKINPKYAFKGSSSERKKLLIEISNNKLK